MSWGFWLSIPPLATLGAIAWTSWSSRQRRPEQTVETVRAHQRFTAALGETNARRSKDRS